MPSVFGQILSTASPPPGFVPIFRTVRSVLNLVCVSVLQSGDGCASILFRYERMMGYLLVFSWARV